MRWKQPVHAQGLAAAATTTTAAATTTMRDVVFRVRVRLTALQRVPPVRRASAFAAVATSITTLPSLGASRARAPVLRPGDRKCHLVGIPQPRHRLQLPLAAPHATE